MSKVLRSSGRALGALALLALSGTPAQAADAKCVVKNRSSAIAIVVCPAGTEREALQAAGIRACKDLNPCNAWIWEDANKAPATAPEKDTDMPKSVTGAARAVWVNGAENLIELRKVR